MGKVKWLVNSRELATAGWPAKDLMGKIEKLTAQFSAANLQIATRNLLLLARNNGDKTPSSG